MKRFDSIPAVLLAWSVPPWMTWQMICQNLEIVFGTFARLDVFLRNL